MEIAHTYYISINPKKIERMEKHILPPHFTPEQYTRISGIEGTKLNPAQLHKQNVITKHGLQLFVQRGQPYGTLGCYLAHCRLWDYIHKKHASTDNILILEDDIEIDPDFHNKFKKLTTPENLPPQVKWDIIYYDHNTVLGTPLNRFYTIPHNHSPAGTNAFLSCYLIKVASIPKLLKICTPIGQTPNQFAIDSVMRNNFHKINALFYNNHLAKQRKELGSCRIGRN